MKIRTTKRRHTLIVNPFVSEAQRRACYAKDDPGWDCKEWESKSTSTVDESHPPKGKKLPKRKGSKSRSKTVRNAVRRANPRRKKKLSRIDPTRTATIRRHFLTKLRKRFALLKGRIVRFIGTENAFGFKKREPIANSTRQYHFTANSLLNRATTNAAYDFHTDPDKIKAFQEWLASQLTELIRGRTEEELWKQYIDRGYQKGAGRAFDDARAAERAIAEGTNDQRKLDFYAGTREEFLRSAFGQPESVEKVKLLAGRSFDDLENVTADMSARMSRALVDGLIEGKGPMEVAGDLTDVVDIGRSRAETIARTELIRAHAEGQLDAMERLGVEEVGVAVEWSTAGDNAVCERCQPMEGVVLTIDEARNMIPMHPNCRCAFVPANVGEDEDEQKRTKDEIEDALDEAGLDDVEIDRRRPESVLNTKLFNSTALPKSEWLELLPVILVGALEGDPLLLFSEWVNNAFCATGKGGGVDPTCPARSHGIVAYSISKDRPWLNETEKKEYNTLFKRQQELFKKQKAGRLSEQEKEESTKAKERLNELSKVAKGREKAGVGKKSATVSTPKPTPQQRDTAKPTDRPKPIEMWSAEEHRTDILARATSSFGTSNLDKGVKALYSESFREVLNRMPLGALQRLSGGRNGRRGLEAVDWHGSTRDVTKAYEKTTGTKVGSGFVINGFYGMSTGRLNLDGWTTSSQFRGETGSSGVSMGTYAHEMTHALDRGYSLSNSQEWQDAFKSEISQEARSQGKPRLSKYAETAFYEGFAEFGRMLYGSKVDKKWAEGQYPKCFAFFRRNGLWT